MYKKFKKVVMGSAIALTALIATSQPAEVQASQGNFDFRIHAPAPHVNSVRRTTFRAKTNNSNTAAWVNPRGTFTATTFALEESSSLRLSTRTISSVTTSGQRNFTWASGFGAQGTQHRLVGHATNFSNPNSYQVQGTWRP